MSMQRSGLLYTEVGIMLTCTENETCLFIPCFRVQHFYRGVHPCPLRLFLLMNARFLPLDRQTLLAYCFTK